MQRHETKGGESRDQVHGINGQERNLARKGVDTRISFLDFLPGKPHDSLELQSLTQHYPGLQIPVMSICES